jgi:L-lactate dehydrogenase complex protein LldE
MTPTRPRVGLFVTCLVDMMRPSVGFAAVRLLENAGCTVEVPQAQTCCGQPAYNSGDRKTAADLALGVIAAFEPYDHVVVPSGSCAGMIACHYPLLFAEGSPQRRRAEAMAAKTHELISFLTDVMGVTGVDAAYDGKVTYHDCCSGLRELAIKVQPRHLLGSVKGLELVEMGEPEICCGFGGTFCIKYPQISNDMADKKVSDAEATGADLLLAGDLGCLMNMAGKLKRRGSPLQVRHVAEVLAGDLATPAIAEGEG